MADLILGQPTNLTTVTAGSGGNVRVTYPPWELDWEWFDTIAVGHWLANTTTGVSDDVVAKGGTEATGYWFEISTAFPDANWNSGDRITPQRQAAINQFATFALAIAAMAMNDTFLVWYKTTSNRRAWYEPIAFNGVAGSAWGMLSRCQIIIVDGVNTILLNGNLLGQNQQAYIVNFRCSAFGASSTGPTYQPAAGQAGAGARFSRCISSGTLGTTISGNAAANTCQVDNCIYFLCGTNAIAIGARDCKIYNNTSVFCNVGFSANTAGVPSVGNLNDHVSSECLVCFTGAGSANARNSADTDGTLPVDATNLRNQDARTQLQFFFDLARPGNKAFPRDARIHHDSVLAGRGVAIAGLTRDADGVLRPDPPSIGAYEPQSTAYAPGAAIVRGANSHRAHP